MSKSGVRQARVITFEVRMVSDRLRAQGILIPYNVWEGFFKTVEKATGKPIKFKVFDNSGTILSIILDMEAAQVQGLGTTILRMKLNGCKSNETNPDIIVQYLIKLCVVHWQRYAYNFVLSLSYLTAEL